MGVLECGAMAIRGTFDAFDLAIGVIEHLEGLVVQQEMPTQLHVPTPQTPEFPAHLYEPKVQLLADLSRAKELVTEACQITQNVAAEM